MNQATKCPQCEENPAADPHPCPYAIEVNESDRLCTCCQECTQNCREST